MKSSGKGGLLCPVSSEQEPNFAQHQLVNTDALITSTNTTSSPSPPLQCPSVLVLQHSPALKKPLTFCFSGVELSLFASFPYCTSIMPSLTSIQLYFSLTVLGQKMAKKTTFNLAENHFPLQNPSVDLYRLQVKAQRIDHGTQSPSDPGCCLPLQPYLSPLCNQYPVLYPAVM